uniref:hypothetical protein n=1 Tax=Flavobacterium sp. TaxID=239 RepID=UPI00404B6A77
MKKIILILLTTLSLSSCNKDDDQTPIEQLPPATTIGANKAGCLVNGQVFLPKGSSQFGPILSCFYQQDIDGFHFGLAITEKGTNENKSVNISLNPNQLVENTTYNLIARTLDTNNNYNSNFGEYAVSSNINSIIQYVTTNTHIGELKITKLDTQQKIISGTFWYDAILAGEIIEVREGRFDMRYIN